MAITKEEFAALRASGLSPRQIAFMGDDAARAELKGYQEGQAAMAANATPEAGSIRELTPGRDIRARIAQGLALAPDVGGFIGGVLGGGTAATAAAPTGPGALLAAGAGGVRGAALGGAAGRVAQLAGLSALGYRNPSLPEAAMQVGQSGLTQGALQAGGNVLARGAGAIARPLMERALRVSTIGKAISPKLLQRIAGTAIEHRIPVGGARELGSEKLSRAAQLSGKELSKVLSLAHQAGATVEPKNIASEVVQLMDDVLDEPLGKDTRVALYNKLVKFAETHAGPLTPMAAKRLKTKAWELAMPILNKAGKLRPGSVASDALAARFNYAIAKGAQRALEDIQTPISRSAQKQIGTTLKTFGEAIGQREAKTSRILQLEKPLQRAEGATSKVSFSPFGPLRPFGAATPMVRLSRPTVSRLALAASDPVFRRLLQQSPRAAASLLDLMTFQEPQFNEPAPADVTAGQ